MPTKFTFQEMRSFLSVEEKFILYRAMCMHNDYIVIMQCMLDCQLC